MALFGRADINEGVKTCRETEGAVLVDVRDREEYAQGHIAAGFLQDGLGLEEDTGADDDAYHHTDGGEQTVFAFQFLFHSPPHLVGKFLSYCTMNGVKKQQKIPATRTGIIGIIL